MTVESTTIPDGTVLPEEQARHVAERLRRVLAADDAVLNLAHTRQSTVRFSANDIAQSMHRDRVTARLTVAFGNRRGTAVIDAIDEDSLQALARRAEEVARLSPPDPEFLASLGPQDYPEVSGWCAETARLSEPEMTHAARRVIDAAAAAGLQASGTVEASATATCVASSNGLFAYHAATRGEIGCTVASADSSGWARDVSMRLSDLDPDGLVEAAMASARRGTSPQVIIPGRYTTLFLPSAVNHLTSIPVWLADARRTLEGLTFLSDRDDRKLASERITIWSDPQEPRLSSTPFGDDGVPRRRTVWVDKGDFRQMSWDRWTARKNGVEPVPPAEILCMNGTDQSVEDLIAGIERGVLVTRLWYTRFLKIDQTLITGMTRDGTFWIENGRIKHALRNLRFNDTCLGALSRVVAVGRVQRCTATETGPGFFPPLVVRDWNFVDVTGF